MSNEKFYLELALYINNELYTENKITYQMFQVAQENILKQLNEML